jgi:hypothetical protein
MTGVQKVEGCIGGNIFRAKGSGDGSAGGWGSPPPGCTAFGQAQSVRDQKVLICLILSVDLADTANDHLMPRHGAMSVACRIAAMSRALVISQNILAIRSFCRPFPWHRFDPGRKEAAGSCRRKLRARSVLGSRAIVPCVSMWRRSISMPARPLRHNVGHFVVLLANGPFLGTLPSVWPCRVSPIHVKSRQAS